MAKVEIATFTKAAPATTAPSGLTTEGPATTWPMIVGDASSIHLYYHNLDAGERTSWNGGEGPSKRTDTASITAAV
jgi:hypothetical protein